MASQTHGDSSGHPKNKVSGLSVTREGLRDGSLLKAARLIAGPSNTLLSDGEIETSLQKFISCLSANQDVWVFGYGSLIWNPAFEFAEKRATVLPGWHRSFCLSTFGRGTRERPGVMLGLEPGSSCEGIAFRISQKKIEEELLILWRREMISGAYEARWLKAETNNGPISTLAFVVKQSHHSYIGHLSEDEISQRLAFAEGPLGSCHEYLLNTLSSLKAFGISDDGLERIHSKVQEKLETSRN
ncbi:cation transport protein ChaC [Pseudovibrio denitrificans]|uniref:glutathione-specific gamma-glutamylcyclotransferase n=1 Tax=Pseudovibrio denitrificans TaxID=258256 RepID=A0A1I7DQK3_9HYPH|nr:gamma-glutamylcyclotransferase [Pseudovibrio denitrificans]SFU13925.1 cation transport protein ChaC [Pseudovibrio denitrificans]